MREFGFPEIVDLAKRLKIHFSVISANPGSSPGQAPESSPVRSGTEKLINTWTPVSTGVTALYRTIKKISDRPSCSPCLIRNRGFLHAGE